MINLLGIKKAAPRINEKAAILLNVIKRRYFKLNQRLAFHFILINYKFSIDSF